MVERIAPPNARPVSGTPATQRVGRNQLKKDRRSQQQHPQKAEQDENKARKGRNIDEHC